MRVIVSHSLPFALAHGGIQVLVDSLMKHLAAKGVEIEPERWWDDRQHGDILHFFARPTALHVDMARRMGYKIVLTDLLDNTASRSRSQRVLQRTMIRATRCLFPHWIGRLGWDVYRSVDALVFIVPHEQEVAKYLFDAPADRIRVIPHGLPHDEIVALSQPEAEGDYLVSIATIAPRKNTVLLARAARAAQVPVLFLGKPYSDEDEYFKEFLGLVDDRFVRYGGFVGEEEKCRLIRGARGFALFSQFESGCLAAYEAAAAGLPLLLPDLPWARYYPAKDGIQFVKHLSPESAAGELGQFYREAHRRPRALFPVLSWDEIADQYVHVYRRVLEGGYV